MKSVSQDQKIQFMARFIYIDLLCDLLLVRRLKPYYANVGKRLVKTPKVYVRDSGILHALLGISTLNQVSGHPVVGMSWEGFALETLLANLPWRSHAFFYRTRIGAEIDLVIERGDGLIRGSQSTDCQSVLLPGIVLWVIRDRQSTGFKPILLYLKRHVAADPTSFFEWVTEPA